MSYKMEPRQEGEMILYTDGLAVWVFGTPRFMITDYWISSDSYGRMGLNGTLKDITAK